MTSFYKGLKPNFNTTSTIYPGICVPSYVRLRLRVAEILRGKNGGKNMLPQPLHSGPDRPENRRLIKEVASCCKNVYYGVVLCTESNFEALKDVRLTG